MRGFHEKGLIQSFEKGPHLMGLANYPAIMTSLIQP